MTREKRPWRIRNSNGLYWSNVVGWVDRESATWFSTAERADTPMSLSMGGEWVGPWDNLKLKAVSP